MCKDHAQQATGPQGDEGEQAITEHTIHFQLKYSCSLNILPIGYSGHFTLRTGNKQPNIYLEKNTGCSSMGMVQVRWRWFPTMHCPTELKKCDYFCDTKYILVL